ncbi:Alkane hydroxylase MAH1 [Trichinella spiralis]|uniref:Alkane hydroxylase MAH1 n=1 Tax=Trichinella spiralis TaxID=6334 RepID=A0ABR3KTL9_TRISP
MRCNYPNKNKMKPQFEKKYTQWGCRKHRFDRSAKTRCCSRRRRIELATNRSKQISSEGLKPGRKRSSVVRMMVVRLLWFVAAVAFLLHCGHAGKFECNDEFEKFFQCFGDNVKTILADSQSWEDRKAAALKCFHDNDCKAPTLNYQEDVAQMTAKDKDKTMTFINCIKVTINQMVSVVEKCVANTIPGFEFHQTNKDPPIDNNMENSYAYAIMKIGSAANNPEMCEVEKQSKVQLCLKGLSSNLTVDGDQRIKDVCSKRNECFAKLDAICQQKHQEMRQLMRTCSCSGLDMEQFKPDLISCMGGHLDDNKKVTLGAILQRMHDKYCKRMEEMSRVCK